VNDEEIYTENIDALRHRISALEKEVERLQVQLPEEYLQKAFDRANDLIIIIQDGKIKYANPMLESFAGYPFEMIKDKEFKDFLPDKIQIELTKNYHARMAGEKVPERYESVLHHRNGREINVEISGHVITYKGKPADFVVIHDITPLKQVIKKLQESEEKYHNFFKASKDCVFFTAPDGKWLDMSDSAPAFFGYNSKEELAAVPVTRLYEKPEERKEDIERIEKEGFSRDIPINLRKKDGSVIHTLVTSQAIRNVKGEVVAYQGVIRDITEQKKNEELLKKSKIHLEETLTARDKFFSIISHDLRTPFNAIIGLSDFLRKEAFKMPPEEIESIAEDLFRTGQETYELLTNLLEWSRTVTGKIPFSPETFAVADLIYDIRNLYHENIQRKEMKFTVSVPPDMLVYADRNMVHTVIRNLVSNAIKFTRLHGTIAVNAKEKNGYAQINVSDTGIGIQPEILNRLFSHGKEVVMKGTLGESGSGLGLILCKEFMERNGGTITVESSPGKGSTFSFTLPRSVI